jgi:hypothetical protein
VRAGLLLYLSFHERSQHICRADGILGDVVFGHFECDDFRQTEDSVFRREVSGLEGRRKEFLPAGKYSHLTCILGIGCRDDTGNYFTFNQLIATINPIMVPRLRVMVTGMLL